MAIRSRTPMSKVCHEVPTLAPVWSCDESAKAWLYSPARPSPPTTGSRVFESGYTSAAIRRAGATKRSYRRREPVNRSTYEKWRDPATTSSSADAKAPARGRSGAVVDGASAPAGDTSTDAASPPSQHPPPPPGVEEELEAPGAASEAGAGPVPRAGPGAAADAGPDPPQTKPATALHTAPV